MKLNIFNPTEYCFRGNIPKIVGLTKFDSDFITHCYYNNYLTIFKR